MRARELPATFPEGTGFYDTGEDAYLRWPGEGWYRVEGRGLVPASEGDPPTDVVVRGLPVSEADFVASLSERSNPPSPSRG